VAKFSRFAFLYMGTHSEPTLEHGLRQAETFAELDRRLTADPCVRLKQLAPDLGVEGHTIENIVRKWEKDKRLLKLSQHQAVA